MLPNLGGMTFRSIIKTSCLLPHLECRDLEEAVRRLAGALAADGVVRDAEAFAAEILRREREAPTAVGGGLVIPHARTRQAERLGVAVATLGAPVPTAGGEGPVDLVFLIAGPVDDPRGMLRILAGMARLLKEDRILGALRAAADSEAMLAVFRTSSFG